MRGPVPSAPATAAPAGVRWLRHQPRPPDRAMGTHRLRWIGRRGGRGDLRQAPGRAGPAAHRRGRGARVRGGAGGCRRRVARRPHRHPRDVPLLRRAGRGRRRPGDHPRHHLRPLPGLRPRLRAHRPGARVPGRPLCRGRRARRGLHRPAGARDPDVADRAAQAGVGAVGRRPVRAGHRQPRRRGRRRRALRRRRAGRGHRGHRLRDQPGVLRVRPRGHGRGAGARRRDGDGAAGGARRRGDPVGRPGVRRRPAPVRRPRGPLPGRRRPPGGGGAARGRALERRPAGAARGGVAAHGAHQPPQRLQRRIARHAAVGRRLRAGGRLVLRDGRVRAALPARGAPARRRARPMQPALDEARICDDVIVAARRR